MAQDDGVTVRTAIDRNSIYVGDRIRYSIEVSAKKDLEVQLPNFNDRKIGDFEIRDSGTKSDRLFFGGRKLSQWFSITIYSVGEHNIPAFDIRYRHKREKEWLTKKTVELKVTVKSVLPKEGVVSDIKDIKGPVYFREINQLVVVGLAAALFLIAAIAIYKRRKKMPVKLPHEIAMEKLELIRGTLSRTGNVKEYFVAISDCVRHYIERRFALKAPEMTTEEFLNSSKESSSLAHEHRTLLKDFLEACDLVKFARHMPNESEIEKVFTAAKNFIGQTKHVPI